MRRLGVVAIVTSALSANAQPVRRPDVHRIEAISRDGKLALVRVGPELFSGPAPGTRLRLIAIDTGVLVQEVALTEQAKLPPGMVMTAAEAAAVDALVLTPAMAKELGEVAALDARLGRVGHTSAAGDTMFETGGLTYMLSKGVLARIAVPTGGFNSWLAPDGRTAFYEVNDEHAARVVFAMPLVPKPGKPVALANARLAAAYATTPDKLRILTGGGQVVEKRACVVEVPWARAATAHTACLDTVANSYVAMTKTGDWLVELAPQTDKATKAVTYKVHAVEVATDKHVRMAIDGNGDAIPSFAPLDGGLAIQGDAHGYALDFATRTARELPAATLGKRELYGCLARSAAQLVCVDQATGAMRRVDLTKGTPVAVH